MHHAPAVSKQSFNDRQLLEAQALHNLRAAESEQDYRCECFPGQAPVQNADAEENIQERSENSKTNGAQRCTSEKSTYARGVGEKNFVEWVGEPLFIDNAVSWFAYVWCIGVTVENHLYFVAYFRSRRGCGDGAGVRACPPRASTSR